MFFGRLTQALILAWFCLAAGLVHAQTTENSTDSEAQQTEVSEDGAEEGTSEFDLGTPDGEPRIGESYVREKSGAWDIMCRKGEDPETEPCWIAQLILDDQGAPLAQFEIVLLPEGGAAIAGGTVIVPLETALQRQLRITVDGGEGRRYEYAFCAPIGCIARIGMTADDINRFRRGAEAVLQITPAFAPDEVISMPVSLSGFTAGFEQITAVQQ